MSPTLNNEASDAEKCTKRYLLVRMSYTHAGHFRNDLIRRLSVLQGYHGNCLAIGNEAYPVRNSLRRWDDHFSLALLEFESEDWLQRWYTSDPDVKQKDWLGGVDMVSIVPNTNMDAVSGFEQPWFCLAETHAHSPYVSMDELVTMATEPLFGMGESKTVIKTESVVNHRGLYVPGRLVVNYCDGKGPCQDVPTPECSLNALPEADVFLFKLQPLCLPRTSNSNPAAMEI